MLMESKIVNAYFENCKFTDAATLVDELLALSRQEVCEIIVSQDQKEITTASIPQYSSFDDGTVNLIQFLRMAGNFGPSFVEVGKHYLDTGHQERAYIKYGENHAKLSELLGTTVIKNEDRRRIYLNELGLAIERRNAEEQHECFVRLSARVPIVQYALKKDIQSDKELERVFGNYLAASTALRRRRNTWYLISALRGEEQ